jgi:diadenosine tetraphosphate (Ap4A) HIT family hydrolase
MSLLSGIKFVPKERRVEPPEPKARKEEKHSSDRKDSSNDSKRKHDKHNRQHHKSKKSHRDARDERGRKSYESDSESSVDLDKIAAEEEEKERHERREQSSRRKSEPEEEEGVKKFDPNHFRSLMDSLRRPTETAPPASYNSSDEEAERERELERKILRQDSPLTATAPRAAPSAAPVNVPPPAGATNQSAAAMLRDRLKQTRAHLTVPVSASGPGDGQPSHSSNVGVDRDLIALKNKYSQVQGDNASAKQSQAPGQRKRKANLPTDQDADLDVQALKSRERAGGEDIDEVFRENILRLGERYKGTEMGGKGAFGNGDKAGMDEEGDIDMKMFQRKEQSQADALQKEAQRAMKSQQQLRKVVESCRRCTESRTFLRAAVISAGENAILRVKMDPEALVEGHLEIVPVSHVSSILQCDEETQKEIERFQSCLRRMYEKQGKGVLFIETAVHFHSRPHALIDVIPIERGMEDEASMFFKEVSSVSWLWYCSSDLRSLLAVRITL